jgi:nucleoside-diphosphate-sugar epimerase
MMAKGGIRRVLVTGGYGFIGSHTVDALLSRRYTVGVLDNLSTGEATNLNGKVESHHGDIRDYDSVEKAVRGYDAVIHEAALVSVTKSVEDPLTVSMVNVEGTLNLLRAAVKAKVKRFIFASSSSVYGESQMLPKNEDMKTEPVSPYGVSKLAAENYCRAFAKVYGLHTISLRYFNVYGPRQKYGPYSGVIPKFIRQVSRNEPPTIFGDGEQSRDFTYVGDVVQANLLSLGRDVAKGEVLNVATGRPVTINRLASLIIQLEGKTGLQPVHLRPRIGDIMYSYADVRRAKKTLGYSPRFSIEEGLSRVIEWMSRDSGRGAAKALRDAS